MKRSEFIKVAGYGTMACACGQLFSCSSDSSVSPAASKVDFTLDLSASSNSALTVDGGTLVNQGIIIVRVSTGNFVAYWQACTHEGASVNFQSSSKKFVCPRHGATFDINGNVTAGPATKALTKYNTTLTGNSLRVFS
jgi:cytochrome b6-f complex iron-sulfur subunit